MNQLSKMTVILMLVQLMANAQVKKNTLTILPAQRLSYPVSGTHQEGKFRTETECAVQLAKTESLSAAVYCANNQSCFISDHPIDVIMHTMEADRDCSIMYITQKITDGWRYVFGSKNGTNVRMYDAWNETQYKCEDASCVDLYKDDIVNTWDAGNIEKVLVALFDNNKIAAWLEFNAAGANKSGWFMESRLQDSSWTDVITSSHNRFILHSPGYMTYRAFYISYQWFGCPSDLLWIVVSENYPDDGLSCSWDFPPSYPQFQYSKSDSMAQVADLGFAQWFTVFIKQGQ